jgi:hypothetical protein
MSVFIRGGKWVPMSTMAGRVVETLGQRTPH